LGDINNRWECCDQFTESLWQRGAELLAKAGVVGNPSTSNRIAMALKVGRQGLEAPHVGNLSPDFQERESSRSCKNVESSGGHASSAMIATLSGTAFCDRLANLPSWGQREAHCAFRGGRRLAGFIASSCRESD
jgi:hypothetical protein